MAYFYVCAALPALHLGKALPMSKDYLISFISDQVPQLQTELDFVQDKFPYVAFSDTDSSFLFDWIVYNRTLRSALAFHRKFSFQTSESSLTRNLINGFAMHSAAAIAQIPNTLDQESAIYFSMEQGLTELEREYFYSKETLIAYAIRAVLVEKLDAYSKVTGWKNFNVVQSAMIQTKKELFTGKLAVETLLQP